MYLPDSYKSAWIIDGQHRLYGYSRLNERYLRQSLMVVAFECLAVEEEAGLFVTINHEQKSVPRTLLDDLEGDLKWGSEVPTERIGAVAARLITALNNDVGEPLYNRVTAQGIKATSHTCLTVPAVKQGVRRSGLLGRAVLKRRHYQPGPLAGATDLDTLDRSRSFLNLYFSQIQEANLELWDKGREGYVCTNVGVQGFLQLAASIIRHVEDEEGLEANTLPPDKLLLEIMPYLEPILEALHGRGENWAREAFKVQHEAGGPLEYHFRLCRMVREIAPEFAPPGFAKWSEEQSEERIQQAERQLREINIQVQDYIFSTFRAKYGEKDFWESGVPNAKMRVGAYERQQDDPQRLPLENYIHFIEYQNIVSTAEHWPAFKELFDIPERGDKGLAKNLKWMKRLNELRRIPAHPTKERSFTVEDFEYIDWIHREFAERLAKAPPAGEQA